RPNIEYAFGGLLMAGIIDSYNGAVGVLGGEKAAFFRRHVASDVIEDVARNCFELDPHRRFRVRLSLAGERIEVRIARNLYCVEISVGELRLIVKHFLEVRHVPVTINRVTVKSAANVIVHSACSHFAEREQRHIESVFAGIALGIARVESREEIERDWPRKFRCSTESTFLRVITAIDLMIAATSSCANDSCAMT